MIEQFRADTGLLLIDVQKGVDVLTHWGGPSGRRNNADAEASMGKLLAEWRQRGLPVFFTQHDSREAASPLKLSEPGGAWKDGLAPRNGEPVVTKDVNSGFLGTNLEIILRRSGVARLVVAGFFTNMCVETTVRMAGNLGFDTYLVPEACATTNRIGPDGTDHDPELVHDMSVANMHGEFCTALSTQAALALTSAGASDLERVQGNE